jgi:hypothetical protein
VALLEIESAHRIDTAGQGDVDEDECVGRDVRQHPGEVGLRQLGQGELEDDTDKEDCVEDGEALQQVGEARLQLHILLVQNPDTENVA